MFVVNLKDAFLPRDAMPARHMPSVRPAVHLSVTSQYCVKTAKHRIMEATQHLPRTLVVRRQKCPRNSTGVTPYEGGKLRWGRLKSVNFKK